MYAPDELATGENGGGHTRRTMIGAGLVMALLAGVIVAASVANHAPSKGSREQLNVGPQLRPAAPSVAAGPTDLVVESGSFNDEGARQPVPASLLANVERVAGVGGARGVVRGFTRVSPARGSPVEAYPWNGRMLPTVVVSWDAGYFQLTAGRAPARANELAINRQVAQILGVGMGGAIDTESQGILTVVGEFSLHGVADAPRVTLVAASADEADRLSHINGYTRLDVTVRHGQDVETVREAVAAQLPGGYSVFGVNRLGNVQQMQDELLIQRAYFDLLSPESWLRAAAVQGGQDNQQNKDLYQRYASAAAEVTLRIQRYNFEDADHATVVYEIYYADAHSPIISAPQSGAAVRTDGVWKIGTTSLCSFINMLGSPCTAQNGQPPPPTIPPAGFDSPGTALGPVAAFMTIANPQATLDQKVAVVVDGDSLRPVIAAGLARDGAHAGHVQFYISGVRSAGAGQEDVLYVLTVTDDASLDAPYPLIGQAVLVGGSWKVADIYACGLSALAGNSCRT